MSGVNLLLSLQLVLSVDTFENRSLQVGLPDQAQVAQVPLGLLHLDERHFKLALRNASLD